MKRIAILSDIHANLSALESVIRDMQDRDIDAVILIGDIVNYGPRPNEVIALLRGLEYPVLANIWGNHEYSLFGGDPVSFSTDRGRAVLNYTKSILNDDSWGYLKAMEGRGKAELCIEGYSFLLIHGTIEDPYWGKFSLSCVEDERYKPFDYVITGHSHLSHYIEHFYACDNPGFRNRKMTVFINPGSVGQPRNHMPQAQYGILDIDSRSYEHHCVTYDIAMEQSCFDEHIDSFYKDRLTKGI